MALVGKAIIPQNRKHGRADRAAAHAKGVEAGASDLRQTNTVAGQVGSFVGGINKHRNPALGNENQRYNNGNNQAQNAEDNVVGPANPTPTPENQASQRPPDVAQARPGQGPQNISEIV